MKKIVLIALVVATAAYFAATAFAGFSISREMDGLEQNLAASNDFKVHRFDYERGFFSGKLHYDIEYRPVASNEFYEAIREFTGDTSRVLRFDGTADVKHGPYVGEKEWFALAITKTSWPVPEKLGDILREYFPKETPMIKAVSTIGFDGTLTTRFTVADYDGPVKFDSIDKPRQAELVLENLEGTMQTTSQMDRIKISARLERFFMAAEEKDSSYALELADILMDMDTARETDLLWSGDWTLTGGEIGLRENGKRLLITNLATSAKSTFTKETVNNYFELSTNDIIINDISIKGAELRMSFNNVDSGAAETYVRTIKKDITNPGRKIDDEEREEKSRALKRFFASGPSLNIDALNLAFVEPGDISGHLKLYYPPSAPVNVDMPDKMAAYTDVDASIFASSQALEHISRIYAEFESKEHESLYGRPMSSEEIDELARQSLMQTLMVFHFMPFFIVSEEGVESRLEIKDGTVIANGQKVMDAKEFMKFIY